ncbi:MAG: hypothetical protein K6G38_00800 [Gammaproteobacteria bacterium]|nr:hypothetical protein [Gammaproteobacteria bacterium]
MNKNVRTYPVKAFVIALIVVFLGSIGVSVGFIFVDEATAFRVVIWIFMGIFAIGSLIVLLDQLTHYIELSDEYYIKHLLFFKKKYEYKDIQKVSLKKGFFEVYVSDRVVSYFSQDTKESGQIIKILESKKIKIEW